MTGCARHLNRQIFALHGFIFQQFTHAALVAYLSFFKQIGAICHLLCKRQVLL